MPPLFTALSPAGAAQCFRVLWYILLLTLSVTQCNSQVDTKTAPQHVASEETWGRGHPNIADFGPYSVAPCCRAPPNPWTSNLPVLRNPIIKITNVRIGSGGQTITATVQWSPAISYTSAVVTVAMESAPAGPWTVVARQASAIVGSRRGWRGPERITVRLPTPLTCSSRSAVLTATQRSSSATVRGPGTVVRTIPLTVASCGLGNVARMNNCARTPLVARGARASNCDFSGAQLDTLNLRGLDFSHSMFGGTALRDAALTQSRFTRALLMGADFSSRTPSRGRRSDARGAPSTGPPECICQRPCPANSFSVGFQNVTSIGSTFRGAKLQCSSFRGARLTFTDFANAVLCGSSFRGARPGLLARNSFQAAQLCDADFSGSTVLANANLTSANLNRANLRGADATSAVFAGANLVNANFANVKGVNADFSRANMREINLNGAQLRGSKWQGSQLEGAKMDQINMEGSDISGASMQSSSLREGNFAGATMVGVDLSNATMHGINLKGAKLGGTAADSRVSPDDVICANEDGSITLEDGVSIARNGIKVGDYVSLYARPGANRRRSAKQAPDSVRLAGARNTIADLSNSTLDGVRFVGARMAGAVLTGASAKGADFTGAMLAGVQLRDSNLDGSKMQGARMTGANMVGASLRSCDMTGSTMKDAQLVDANLSSAILINVDLRKANFTNAILLGANLSGANLTESVMTNANLGQVVYDAATIWPAGFVPPPLG